MASPPLANGRGLTFREYPPILLFKFTLHLSLVFILVQRSVSLSPSLQFYLFYTSVIMVFIYDNSIISALDGPPFYIVCNKAGFFNNHRK